MKCIAVDDEPLALEILCDYIQRTKGLQLVASYTNPIEAFASIDRDQIELVFLDVQMPELSGIQFMKLLGKKAKVTLTTAYTDYALEGYDHSIIDYLLKPISIERFSKAVERLQLQEVVQETKIDSAQEFIFVRTEHKIVRVDVSDILYVEGLKDYVSIYTTGERILSLMNLKRVEELLPHKLFLRVLKSYIINLSKIDSIEKKRIYIAGQGVPIGDTYKDDFYSRLQG